MAAGDWIRNHRTALLIAATLLFGVFLPLPGLFVSHLFFPAGLHDLDSDTKRLEFLIIVFGVSLVAWALLVNAVLPRKRM